MTTLWKYKNPQPLGTYTTVYETEMISYLVQCLEDNKTLNKFCVEFGAADGLWFSNTRQLILNGWKSIQIEPNEKFNQLKSLYENNQNVICLRSMVSTNKNDANSFDNLMTALIENEPFAIDLVSIDIDSYDYLIFESIEKYIPKIIMMEPNPHTPGCRNHGMSSTTAMANKKGFKLIGYTGNLIFVHNDYFDCLHLEEVSPKQAWDEYWENTAEDLKQHIKNFCKEHLQMDAEDCWKL